MWRNLAKRAACKKLKSPSNPTNISRDSTFIEKIRPQDPQAPLTSQNSILGFRRVGVLLSKDENFSQPGFCNSTKLPTFSPFFKGYSTAAVRAVSSTDESELSGSDETLEMLMEQRNQHQEQHKVVKLQCRAQKRKTVGGMGMGKYAFLKSRQIKIETEAWEVASKEYQEMLEDMCEQKLAPNLPYVKSLFLGWFEPMKNAVLKEQDLCWRGKCYQSYAPYFTHLSADKMAVITMHKLMGLLMTCDEGNGNIKVVQAASVIGEAIENEARIQNLLESTKKKKNGKQNKTEDGSDEVIVKDKNLDADQNNAEKVAMEQKWLRKKVNTLMKKQKTHELKRIIKKQGDWKPWGQDAQIKIGSLLMHLLIETSYLQPQVDQLGDAPPDIRPAFVHTVKTLRDDTLKISRKYGVIQCDPLIRKGLEKSARHMVIPYMPMLVPPMNWTGYSNGAYFFLPSYLMRIHGSKQQRDAVKRTPVTHLGTVFEGLNTLGNTKWRINKRVLDVVDRIWASGGCLAGLIDREDVPLPEEPATEDEKEIRKWKWKIKNARKENNERHAQRCDVELKLAVARKMKNEEGFYYPHNLDFRGRAYPMHPHLNHLGSDLCRGILEFAEGRPLGKSGLRWLKIHLANVYGGGVDKLSYDGRLAFAEGHVDDIFDSTDRPLEGRRWWLGAEDPFQCLATCISIAEALRSSNPETTISHMHIHQDGSCNGLQHYAALGRDKLGGAAVNLVTGERPADVYSGIAARVHDIMQSDSEKDPSVHPNAKYAKLLIDQVDRKLVKQTVMTSVYGVTYIGARDQIKKRLKERDAIADDSELYAAACYAAKITMAALEEMFEGAKNMMAWLGECAKIIASENEPVRWTTPIGLPVIQPYKHLGRHLIKTSLQVLALQRETDKVMVKRQRTAFPPNFVHSLDGSHMMMTAIACKNAGLNFAGVHDSYWTHACDVDKLNTILREKFVELYEAPILENLLENFQKSFPELNFPPIPERGDLDLREVLQSPYFFN